MDLPCATRPIPLRVSPSPRPPVSRASGSCTNSEYDHFSDTESLSSFLSEGQSSLGDESCAESSEASGWSSFNEFDSSSQYDSESNEDSEASVGYEFASMSLDTANGPVARHGHHHSHRHHDALALPQQQRQQQTCGAAPHSEVVWVAGPPPPDSLPASPLPAVRQITELEAMMAELAGLKSDYSAVHNKLDLLASNLGRSAARLDDGSVGIPAVVDREGRRSRCGTPTPADGSAAAAAGGFDSQFGPLCQTGFKSLSARIPWMPDEEVDDTWLEKVDSGISPASMAMEFELAPGGSSVDHFTRAMLGMY